MLASLATAAPALPAFDISPASITTQAGDTATGTLSNLPVGNGGEAGCLEAASGTSVYLSVVFSTVCGGQPGWSSSMTIRTIPATPAGTYTIVFQVCPNEACSIPDIRNVPPIATGNLTVVVTAAPVPVETVPNTASTSPAPASPPQTLHPAPTPSRSVPRTLPPAAISPSGTQAPPVAPTPTPSLSPGPSPAAAGGGVAPGLVLDHPVLKAGQTLRVSGTGCVPGAPATVALPGFVTGTTTAGPGGAREVPGRGAVWGHAQLARGRPALPIDPHRRPGRPRHRGDSPRRRCSGVAEAAEAFCAIVRKLFPTSGSTAFG